jgi:hypothetical protein
VADADIDAALPGRPAGDLDVELSNDAEPAF